MRLNSGGIRFLAADEPTSALDPEGEFALFNRLREQRGGKTVVFYNTSIRPSNQVRGLDFVSKILFCGGTRASCDADTCSG